MPSYYSTKVYSSSNLNGQLKELSAAMSSNNGDFKGELNTNVNNAIHSYKFDSLDEFNDFFGNQPHAVIHKDKPSQLLMIDDHDDQPLLRDRNIKSPTKPRGRPRKSPTKPRGRPRKSPGKPRGRPRKSNKKT